MTTRSGSPLLRALAPLLLFLLSATQAAQAQDGGFARLMEHFRSVSRFDHEFPREKVYLHFDNTAYLEGDTIWYKANVVRASTLRPEPLSRVLYVELLGADGRLVERNLLRLDSVGCASGEFVLKLPVRRGFYEVRAYTREMTNWGTEACFSRVFPVFERPDGAADDVALETFLPSSTAELPPGYPRPFPYLESRRSVRLDFYPESGRRVEGLPGFVAFKLTDGKGQSLDSIVRVVSADGSRTLAEARTRHDGMGKLLLPANTPADAYALVGTKRFELPAATHDDYALTVEPRADGGHDVTIQKRPGAPVRLLGLLVTCREQACYFDTLTVTDMPVLLELQPGSLHGGVNRIELFGPDGRSLARRLVWKQPAPRNYAVEVRQNETEYTPFSPVALEVYVKDGEGRPVETAFSLSVRDTDGQLAAGANESLLTDMLLSSELKGYVHNPAYYFESRDTHHREALDLLLMVQGWSANTLDVMTGADTFRLKQPIEERLTLNGHVYRDKDKLTPMAGTTLSLKMYSREGGALEGRAVTDETGYFAFESNLDFCGNWIAQLTTMNEAGKRRSSRVTLDRWFDVRPRPFAYAETTLLPPPPPSQAMTEAETFEWEDTIPRYVSLDADITEAVVARKNSYRGLSGGRYSYNGGEKAGMAKADIFYNIEREVEQMKDRGEQPGTIWKVLARIDSGFDYDRSLESGYIPDGEAYAGEALDGAARGEQAPGSNGLNNVPGAEKAEKVTYHNRKLAALFLNNYDKDPMLDEVIWAEEIKSVILMHGPAKWQKFCSQAKDARDIRGDDALFLYTRPDYSYFLTKRGVDKRMVQGYSQPRAFYAPQYNGIDLPSGADLRRTLYWNPDVRTDAEGKASVVFFSNAREGQHLGISLRGITPEGAFVEYER